MDDRYWELKGKLYTKDLPVLVVSECRELDYISEETKEYMQDREYAHRIYSNIYDDLINMQYNAIIHAKDQITMLKIFEDNTTAFKVIWDAKIPMLYKQKLPKEDPNADNG